MARYVLQSAIVGALVALGMYAAGSAVAPTGPAKSAWLVLNTLINPSWFLGVTTFYEVPMGSYGPQRVLILAGFNTAIYAAGGWSIWMARHRSRWFWLAAPAVSGPFVVAASYIAIQFLT